MGRPHDLDNNKMLSLIEQKMCIDDRKIWARELEREDKPASLQRLMSWMETEMKSRTHWVDQCEEFNSMSPDEGLKAVRENHACFSCLKKAGRDHRASNCSRRKQCTQKINGLQCKYHHHVLLHPVSPPEAVNVALLGNNTEAMLPVITVKISGKNNQHKDGNILLDSGAQISLICTSTAQSLQLKGKDVSITIKKVGGE